MVKSRVFPFALGWMLVLVLLAVSVGAAFGADGVYPPLPKNSADAVNGFVGQEGWVSTSLTPVDPDRWMPRAAYDSNHGRHLVVWHESPANGKPRLVRGQLLDQNSQKIGGNFVISEGNKDRAQPVAVFSTISNKYLVVYMMDITGDGKKFGIEGQFVSANGELQGGEFSVVDAVDVSYWSPEIAWNSQFDEFVVVFGALSVASQKPLAIGLTILDHRGYLIYGTTLTDSGYPTNPAITYDGVHDQYLVAWQFLNASGKTAIQGDLRDSLGNRVRLVPIYSAADVSAAKPRLTSSRGLFYFAIWEYGDNPTDHDIYINIITWDGLTSIPTAYMTATTNDTNPDIAGSDRIINWVVVFQRADVNGSKIMMMPGGETATPLCDYFGTDCLSPAITYGGGRYISVFLEDVNMGGTSANSPLSPLAIVQHVYEKIIHSVVVYLPHVLQ